MGTQQRHPRADSRPAARPTPAPAQQDAAPPIGFCSVHGPTSGPRRPRLDIGASKGHPPHCAFGNRCHRRYTSHQIASRSLSVFGVRGVGAIGGTGSAAHASILPFLCRLGSLTSYDHSALANTLFVRVAIGLFAPASVILLPSSKPAPTSRQPVFL